jgi:hypothetical protein
VPVLQSKRGRQPTRRCRHTPGRAAAQLSFPVADAHS